MFVVRQSSVDSCGGNGLDKEMVATRKCTLTTLSSEVIGSIASFLCCKTIAVCWMQRKIDDSYDKYSRLRRHNGGWKTIIAFPDRISRECDNYLDVFSNSFKSPFKSPFNYLDVLCCIGRLCRAESILFQRLGCFEMVTLSCQRRYLWIKWIDEHGVDKKKNLVRDISTSKATLVNSAVAHEIVLSLLTDSAKPFGVTNTINSNNPDGALVVRSLPCELPFALIARRISESCQVTQAQQGLMKYFKVLTPQSIPGL